MQTYQDSLDCPELQGLRCMDDVIQSHKASGQFEQDCWRLLYRRQEALGVLLMSPLRASGAMELTYMGLCPAARRRGLGGFILQEAIDLAERGYNRYLTLAVDCRNHHALRMYSKFGFDAVLRRTVFIRSLSS